MTKNKNESEEKPIKKTGLLESKKSSDLGIKIFGVAIITVIFLGVVWGIVFTGKGASDKTKTGDPSATVTVTASPDPSDVFSSKNKEDNTPGGTAAETKEALLLKTSDFLTEAWLMQNKLTSKDFQELIVNGDSPKLSKKYKDYLKINSVLTEERLVGTAYAAFIYSSAELVASFNGAEVKPIVESPEKNVFVDMDAGVAFVPLNIYRGPNTALSINWVFVDGEWKIYPYSFLDGLQTVEIIDSNSRDSDSSAVEP